MVNLGRKEVRTAKDGWTVIAKDLKPSAHYEHTVAVKDGEADILSDHSGVEAAILDNDNVKSVSLKTAAV